MNKLTIAIVLFFTAFFLSCSEDYLEVAPRDRYSDAAVWEDPALIEAFVNGIYQRQHTDFNALMTSSLCDESMDVWNWGPNGVMQSDISPSSYTVLYRNHWNRSFHMLTWDELYKSIRACNVFLGNMESSMLSGDDIDQLKGEVYFMRAHFYHILMSLFGGVPLIDEPLDLEDDLAVSRNTFEETINFIVADCDTAAALLQATGDKARATQGAALGLKSRTLLYAASKLHQPGVLSTGSTPANLVAYTEGDVNARWQAAKAAAKAVIDLNVYSLYGGTSPATAEEATANYANMFLNNGNEEDMFLYFYDNVTENMWDTPDVGLFNGPNGYHNWGGNTPIGQLVDDYEMMDGTKFDWSNPVHSGAPYENRDPRFYASILYDGAKWRERPADVIGIDPEGIVQTGFYEQEDGSFRAGLDTRKGPIEDWNGTYSGYYLRKFIDPAIDHQFERQRTPWRQMRYAEILLNYAEACLELGEEEEAKTYINMIRSRAGMPNVPAGESGEALMDRYRNERRIELAYEKHRFFDIRRWMIAPEAQSENAKGVDIRYALGSDTPTYSIIDVRDMAWDDKAYFLPILLDEINRNENLVQNPLY